MDNYLSTTTKQLILVYISLLAKASWSRIATLIYEGHVKIPAHKTKLATEMLIAIK